MPRSTPVTPQRCALQPGASLGGPHSAPIRVRSSLPQWLKGWHLSSRGEGDRGPRRIRRAVALLERSDELRDDPRLLAWVAMGPLWLREAAQGQALVLRALTDARSRSAAGVLPFLLGHVGIDYATRDRWVEAEAAFYEAIDVARESGQDSERAVSLARLSWLEARQGKEATCMAHASEALDLSRRLGLGPCEIWTLAALGDLELGRGRPEEARIRYEEQQTALLGRGIHDVDLSPGPELVEVYLRTGRVEQAAEAAAAFGREATVKQQPWALAHAARARGLVAPDGASETHFDEALVCHTETRTSSRPHAPTLRTALSCEEIGKG